jgi:hypothetical protein
MYERLSETTKDLPDEVSSECEKERNLILKGEVSWSIEEADFKLLQIYEKKYGDVIKAILEKKTFDLNDLYRLQTFKMVLERVERRHKTLMVHAIAKSIGVVLAAMMMIAAVVALFYYVVVPWWSWIWFGGFMATYVVANGFGVMSCYTDHITPMSSFSINTVISFIIIGFVYENFVRGIRYHIFMYSFFVTTCLYIVSIVVGLSIYFYMGDQYIEEEEESNIVDA